MSKKKKVKIVAVIDIGSGGIRLQIAQESKKGYKVLDYLVHNINLGKDVYEKEKISFEKVETACIAIKNFLNVIKEYGVDEVMAVATTCIREATNKDYILDQIKIKTGLDIHVLDDYQEKRYISRSMYSMTPKKYLKSSLMIYVGSGNIGISLLENTQITHMQNIKAGSVRIKELFADIRDHSTGLYLVTEQYLDSITRAINLGEKEKVKYLIISSHEMSVIAMLCEARKEDNFTYISKKKLLDLYEEIKFKTVDQIVFDYKIQFNQAETLFSSMCVYHNLAKFAQEDTIVVPEVLLADAITLEMLHPDVAKSYADRFNKNIIVQGRILAKSFKCSELHIELVEKFSLLIFDKLKKLHGLGQRERTLLQMSAILHDIGKFINIKMHYMYSYSMIKGLDIVDLDCREMEILATICLYHSDLEPSVEHEYFNVLEAKDRLIVSKVAAILSLADSLDRSIKQKFQNIEVSFVEQKLIISVRTDENIELEQWAFDQKSEFFEEVFGVKAILKKKKVT